MFHTIIDKTEKTLLLVARLITVVLLLCFLVLGLRAGVMSMFAAPAEEAQPTETKKTLATLATAPADFMKASQTSSETIPADQLEAAKALAKKMADYSQAVGYPTYSSTDDALDDLRYRISDVPKPYVGAYIKALSKGFEQLTEQTQAQRQLVQSVKLEKGETPLDRDMPSAFVDPRRYTSWLSTEYQNLSVDETKDEIQDRLTSRKTEKDLKGLFLLFEPFLGKLAFLFAGLFVMILASVLVQIRLDKNLENLKKSDANH